MTPKFIQPAFIRRNTPELRKKLEKLGYMEVFCYKSYPILIAMETDLIPTFSDRLAPIYTSTCKVDVYVDKGFIDCGDNEQLFLALAALREDSDKCQWFCDDEAGEYKSLFFCKYDDVEQHIHNEMDGWDCEGFHKATLEELIEHFKDK